MVLNEFYKLVNERVVQGSRSFRGKYKDQDISGYVTYYGCGYMEIRFHYLSSTVADELMEAILNRVNLLDLQKYISERKLQHTERPAFDISLIIEEALPPKMNLHSFFIGIDSSLCLDCVT